MLKQYKDIIENIVGLVIVFAVILLGFAFFDVEEIKAFIERGGPIAPIVLVLAKASTMVFAPVSGSPIYPLAGALFGFWEGFALLMIGDFIGSCVSFFISRKLGRKVVERFARGNIPMIDRILTFMETTKGFLIARVCFMALPEATSYAAGLTRISFKRFIVIQTAVDVVPVAGLAAIGAWFATSTHTFSMILMFIGGTVAAILGGIILVKAASLKKSQVMPASEPDAKDISWPDKSL